MRKALYWDLHNPDPQKALKFYKEALRKVEEIGMDPFSKEVLGIKIQLASLFERYHNYNKAIEVLEIVRRDCYAWVDKLGGIHMTDGKRTRVLGQAAAMGVKLGELYSLPYVDDQEAAEAALVTAVETMLKEKRRREKEGVKDGEGDWKTDEEMGASFEGMVIPHHTRAQYTDFSKHSATSTTAKTNTIFPRPSSSTHCPSAHQNHVTA